ncbi:MAG: cysteine hydrolase [Chloroflexi bacterium]|nr:cysteine hydrolase [Chloroflexota bacterium]
MKLSSVDLAHSTIIVIDIQNDFCHEDGCMARGGKDVSFVQSIVPGIIKLVAEARRLKVPIIHVKTEHSQWTNSPSWLKRIADVDVSGLLRPGTWGTEFYKVIPEPGDYIVTKHRYTAFLDTDLDLVLRSQDTKTVVLLGCATNVCVESTARDAFNKDYYLVLVKDCLAAYSRETHRATLVTMEENFGAVVSSPELIAAWQAMGRAVEAGARVA